MNTSASILSDRPTSLPRLLYCHCAQARVLPVEVRQAALRQLCASGLPFEAVPDLCQLVARRSPLLLELARSPACTIAACHPRALKWLFAAAEAPLSPDSTSFVDLRRLTASEAAPALSGSVATLGPSPGRAGEDTRFQATLAKDEVGSPRLWLSVRPHHDPGAPAALADWMTRLLDEGCRVSCEPEKSETAIPPNTTPETLVNLPDSEEALLSTDLISKLHVLREDAHQPAPASWFPVIDFDRCTHCMQCLSFCLFDVYGVSADRRLETPHPANCKTNCPACSRVCPELAIIFPKHKTSPINGDEIRPHDQSREAVKVDISALLGGDIYARLRERSGQARERFSKERDPALALEERRKCLVRLAQAADIPPEVIMALPTAEEIQRRADAAAAKARQALAAPPS